MNFTIKRPRLAICAMLALVFVGVIVLAPLAHLDKIGFLLGTGIGVYFIITAGKAMRAEFGNLAVLLAFVGMLMVLFAFFGTAVSTIAASSIDDLAPSIVGAVSGLFTGVEEDG